MQSIKSSMPFRKSLKTLKTKNCRRHWSHILKRPSNMPNGWSKSSECLRSPKRKKCNGMAGLSPKVRKLWKRKKAKQRQILALQKVEHYEIAAYGALVSWAKLLKEEKASAILQETLNEEKEADEKLNDIAEDIVNLEEGQTELRKKAA